MLSLFSARIFYLPKLQFYLLLSKECFVGIVCSRAWYTNNFSFIIQISWKFHFAVVTKLIMNHFRNWSMPTALVVSKVYRLPDFQNFAFFITDYFWCKAKILFNSACPTSSFPWPWQWHMLWHNEVLGWTWPSLDWVVVNFLWNI